jgi:hypothetical protein
LLQRALLLSSAGTASGRNPPIFGFLLVSAGISEFFLDKKPGRKQATYGTGTRLSTCLQDARSGGPQKILWQL